MIKINNKSENFHSFLQSGNYTVKLIDFDTIGFSPSAKTRFVQSTGLGNEKQTEEKQAKEREYIRQIFRKLKTRIIRSIKMKNLNS